MAETLLILAVLFLSYSNGANDNFKGVATLFGSGTAGYARCLAWATVTTLAGSLLALVFAGGLVAAFSGKGLVPDDLIGRADFLSAVAGGAAATVMLATVLGLPVSTTHALTGALVGAGVAAAGFGGVKFAALGRSFLLPLLASPVLSLTATVLLYPVLRWARRRAGVIGHDHVQQADGTLRPAREPGTPGERYGDSDDDREARTAHQGSGEPDAGTIRGDPNPDQQPEERRVVRYDGRVAGMPAGPLIDVLHMTAGGAVGFARGLNDTPKIVALLMAGAVLPTGVALALVGAVMAIGGLVNSRKIAETMGRKIAGMNPGQGLTAGLVTAVMVTVASRAGLPVSTTHVTVGAITGVGLVNGTARLGTIATILTAWVTTLPMGAVTAWGLYLLTRAG